MKAVTKGLVKLVIGLVMLFALSPIQALAQSQTMLNLTPEQYGKYDCGTFRIGPKPFYRYDDNLSTSRIDSYRRTAVVCYNQQGWQLSANPYPINENDRIEVNLFVLSSEADQYYLEVKGDAKPSVSGRVAPVNGETVIGRASVTRGVDEITDKVSVLTYYVDPVTSGKITIKIMKREIAEPIRTYEIYVNFLYHFRPQVGVAFSYLPENSYGLVTDKSGKTRITIKEGGDENIQYMASLAIYPYGRDLTQEPSLVSLDRISLLLGFGLEKPQENIFVGASYDLSKGAFVSIGLHLGYREILDGDYKDGDLFTGDESDIPTSKEWVYRDKHGNPAIFWAINLDPIIMSQILRNPAAAIR